MVTQDNKAPPYSPPLCSKPVQLSLKIPAEHRSPALGQQRWRQDGRSYEALSFRIIAPPKTHLLQPSGLSLMMAPITVSVCGAGITSKGEQGPVASVSHFFKLFINPTVLFINGARYSPGSKDLCHLMSV